MSDSESDDDILQFARKPRLGDRAAAERRADAASTKKLRDEQRRAEKAEARTVQRAQKAAAAASAAARRRQAAETPEQRRLRNQAADEAFMKTFMVANCTNRRCPDANRTSGMAAAKCDCFHHERPGWRRRNPYTHRYSHVLCHNGASPTGGAITCPRGDGCWLAHNFFERSVRIVPRPAFSALSAPKKRAGRAP
jgi:hypothetical protein